MLQQAVRYVTGRVVVRPSILKPPDITKPYKNSPTYPEPPIPSTKQPWELHEDLPSVRVDVEDEVVFRIGL